MSKIDDKYPQFIRIDEEKKNKYLEPLVGLPGSLFFKRELGEVYLIAASLGYKNQLKEKSNKSKEVRTYHGLSDNSKLLIRIIVLSSENFNYELLNDGVQTLKIIEEFANGGVSLLHDKIFNSGTSFSLEEEIWSEIKSVNHH
jgi:hypothetical protein